MSSTAVQICNLALARIGVKDPIESLTENTQEGLVCNSLYAVTRDAVLCSLWWPFATRRATLAVVSSESTRSGWAYVYALPSDCLSPRYIWTGERAPSADARIPYALELSDNEASRILLTDEENAVLVYTMAVTNTLLFPPLFVDALAWSLAAEIAMPLAVRSDLRQTAQQMALAMQTRAASVALTEGFESEPTTPTIAARD